MEDYLAQVGARLPGPVRERADIIAELRGGLLDAVDAYRDAGLSAPDAAATAIEERARDEVDQAFVDALAAPLPGGAEAFVDGYGDGSGVPA